MENIESKTVSNGILHFTTRNTDLQGYYELSVDNKIVSAFAVNPPEEESRLERINLRKIPRFIPLEQEVGKGTTVKEKVTLLRDGYDMSNLAISTNYFNYLYSKLDPDESSSSSESSIN